MMEIGVIRVEISVGRCRLVILPLYAMMYLQWLKMPIKVIPQFCIAHI